MGVSTWRRAPESSRSACSCCTPPGPEEEPLHRLPVGIYGWGRRRAGARRRAGRYAGAVLGLPDSIRGCLFDLDGVLTKTAKVHAAAWKEMFDSFLRERARQTGQPIAAFDPVKDYDEYVDGKPRAAGTRSFLASRGIELPEGQEDAPPDPPPCPR